MLKSTVPPKTTEDIVHPILSEHAKVHLGFSPERLAEGKAIEEFLSIPVVVGGVDAISTSVIADFWRQALDIEVIELRSSTAAELVKLADNWWIDLNIAMAHEVAKISDKMGVDALEVISAANSLPKGQHFVNILYPSVGVGGYCLTKDPWFVHHYGKRLGVDIRTPVVSREINDGMPEYSFDIIKDYIDDLGIPYPKVKVAICGVSFKNNTGDIRFTPTKLVIDKLIELGVNVEVCDPWVTEDDAEKVTDRDLVTLDKALENAHVAAFLAGHDEFKALTPEHLSEVLQPKALVFDGRLFPSAPYIESLKAQGLVYQGVGRS